MSVILILVVIMLIELLVIIVMGFVISFVVKSKQRAENEMFLERDIELENRKSILRKKGEAHEENIKKATSINDVINSTVGILSDKSYSNRTSKNN
jgi:predicted Holliday junction resolvase-like endonuclease